MRTQGRKRDLDKLSRVSKWRNRDLTELLTETSVIFSILTRNVEDGKNVEWQ